MAMFQRISGTWREVAPWVRVSGTWRQVQEGWVRVSGVWQQFYANISLKLNNIFVSGSSAQAGFELHRNGELSFGTGNDTTWTVRSDEWVDDGRESDVGDAFEAKLDKVSGDDPTFGPTLGAWTALSSDKQWRWNPPANFSETFEGTLTIRDVATSGSDYSVSCDVDITVVNI